MDQRSRQAARYRLRLCAGLRRYHADRMFRGADVAFFPGVER
jgi:hypothetical protein